MYNCAHRVSFQMQVNNSITFITELQKAKQKAKEGTRKIKNKNENTQDTGKKAHNIKVKILSLFRPHVGSHVLRDGYTYIFFPMAQQPVPGQGLLIIDASQSHSDTLYSVGLLCTRDQPDSETCTLKRTTLKRDRQRIYIYI